MKIVPILAAASLLASLGLATGADAHPRGWHPHPHCTTMMVHHHKVRRCH